MHVASFAHPARNVKAFSALPGSTVADFGAGSGAYTFELAREVGETGCIYAIDVQPDLLRRIKNEAHRRGLRSVHTLWGDAEREHGTKIGNGLVDLVLMSNVLFQIEHPLPAFAEAHRILKKGGRLVVIDWTDAPRSGTQGFAHIGPARKHIFKKDKALECAIIARFRLTEEFSAGAHHYGLIFERP